MFTVFCKKPKWNWKFYIFLCRFLATSAYVDVLIQGLCIFCVLTNWE